jgi:hypothetical protein
MMLGTRQDIASEVARAFHDQVELHLFGKTGIMCQSWGQYNANL